MTAVTMDSNGDNWDPALSRLLSSLEECGSAETEEASFLAELLRSRALHALVAAHNRIVAAGRDARCRPLLATGTSIAIDVIDIFNETEQPTDLAAELLHLLQSPHLQAVLCAHDAVAQKDYAPRLPAPPAPTAPDDDEQTVKIVQLVKSDEPLGGAQSAEPIVGATIKSDEQTGRIVIARVMHGGAADRSGLIHAGDEVVEVNGVDVESKTPADVLAILQSSEGTITFKLVPAGSGAGGRESKVRVRALFDYRAADDPHIPCKEAGLDFQKGDVLHIVCQDDAYWWQARREGERRARAGLVPSRALQESRVMHQRQTAPLTLDGEVAECPGTTAAAALLPCKTAVKVKKITYDVSEKDDFDRECIPTYEEVARLYPRTGRHRPLVLVGAPGVGRNELRRRLLATDPALYASPIPLTSRAQRSGERAGEQYEFTTREALEHDAGAGRLLEHGEYKGHLYATTTASVHALIDAGRICVLSPHWQALRMLRTARLRPYIIFIKPPALERLVETRTATHARSTFDKDNNRAFTEEEFTDIIRSSNRISFLYGHLFDEEIVNEDIGTALSALLRASWKVQSEPLWVPSSWVQ